MEDSRLKADRAGTKVRDGHEPAPEGERKAEGFREERDLLGTMRIPAEDLRGIHTFRALDNFQLSGRSTHPALVRAYALVKKACALANAETGWLDRDVADAICLAADEAVRALERERERDKGSGGAGTVPAPISPRGGPQNGTLFLVLYIYRNAFEYLDMGYAATLSWVLFAIIGVLTSYNFV